MKQRTQGFVGQVKDVTQGITQKIQTKSADFQRSEDQSNASTTDHTEHQNF